MTRPKQKRAQETRERILDCAVEVFHERGVARPSLTDVADLAGVTRGAIYGHFENKADLFAALCDRVRLPTEAFGEADSNIAMTDPLGELRESWLFLLRECTTNPEYWKILDIIFHRCELVEESGQIKSRLHAGHQKGTTHMAALLQRAATIGQLPADLDIDAAMPLLHASLIGMLSTWLFQPDAFDLKAQAERYMDALFDMLRTAPSLRIQNQPDEPARTVL